MTGGIGKLGRVKPAVLQRWVNIRAVRTGRRIGRMIARPRVWLRERHRIRVLESALDSVERQARKLEFSNYAASRVFMNVALYILIAERDISAVKTDALTHPDRWSRSVALRTILITIYEWDMDRISGQRLRRAMEIVDTPDHVRAEVVSSLRDLRKVQRRARTALQEVRNAAIGHRDPDALLQYRVIREIETPAVLELMASFYESADRFIRIVPQLVASGSTISALVKQLGATIDQDPPNA